MNKDYCLLDEPWLPVRLTDGRVVELGLLEVFQRSGEIVALAETAPPSLVAQYRILLAITHRALTQAFGTWKDKDRARWYREGLPVSEICAYLEHWRERFWLFHPEFPFMQVAALDTAEETCDKCKPWTQIALASANGNTPVVFDHAYDSEPTSISPAQAVATLLGYLQFTPGGLVKTIRDADKAGALVNTAAVIPIGETLSKTICLCLHPCSTGFGEQDLPAWEREPLTISELRGDPVLATGPNDRYTRQSRAVLLVHEDSDAIRWLRFAAGLALGEDANAPDPMASFRAGSNGLVRVTFTEGRALWRDLPALVPNPTGESQPAEVLNYAIGLRQLESFDETYQPLLVAGLASDKAKLLRWRVDRIALPADILLDASKALHLRRLVESAELFCSELRSLATRVLSETLPDPSSKDTRSRARDLLDAGPFVVSYYACVERELTNIMSLIGGDKTDDAEMLWRRTLHEAAQSAWDQLLTGMGGSSRALKADAKYWPQFHGLLNKRVPKQESLTVKEA